MKHTRYQGKHRVQTRPSTRLAAQPYRRVGAVVVSGCLALSMCPVFALAQPGEAAAPDAGNQLPEQQLAAPGEQVPPAPEGQMPSMDHEGEFDGNGQPPALPGEGFEMEQGEPGMFPPLAPPEGFDGSAPRQIQRPESGDGRPEERPDQGGMPDMAGAPDAADRPETPGEAGEGERPEMPEAPEMGDVPEMPGAPDGQLGMPGQPGDQQRRENESRPGLAGLFPQTDGQPGGAPDGQPGQPGGMADSPASYDAAATLDADATGTAYSSTADNENAVLVSGNSVTISDVTVTKTGNASGEDADFYGTNAAVLATSGATLAISDADVSSSGSHANGVFSYGTGTTVVISDSTITTTGNNSGGLMTTGGATLSATNLEVSTSGNSSAAIRTDRGGGTVTVSQGTYSTSGVGSPAVYSTADITVSDATLSATKSEAIVIEGGNSVTLVGVDATGSNSTLNGQSTVKTNVLIYQSMSGDASEGESTFTMTDGSLTALTGSMFHVTNTTTTINLTNVDLTNASDSDDLLIATADSWGTSGKNGGHATVNLTSQTASGNITVDSVSSVTLNLKGSSYKGAIGNSGTVTVIMDANSTWTLTGNSSITSLQGDTSGINLNGYTLYVNGVAYTG